MANYNLTSQQIKDTYQQLVQHSGSALVDGLGNEVSIEVSSASFATTASFATNAASVTTQWDDILGVPSGLVSGSSQVDLSEAIGTASNATNAVNATNATTATTATNATNADNIALAEEGTNASRRVVFTATANGDGTLKNDAGLTYNPGTNILTTTRVVADVTGDLTGNVTGNVIGNVTGDVSGNATSASYATNADTLDGFNSDAFPRLQIDNSFTGTQNFLNIAVNGTASIGFLQQVTGSAKIIGDAFIQINTDTPAQRYAGLQVVDSGSTADTASFIWDSLNNDFFYEYEGDDDTDYGVFLIGPEYATKGSPTYPGNNVIQKGTGGHHLTGSNMVDDGTTVTISTPVSASSLKLTSGGVTFADGTSQTTRAQGGLIQGDGTDAIESSGELTTTPADANSVKSIAIGDNARVTTITGGGQNGIAIGSNANIGGGGPTNNNQVVIGASGSASGTDCIAIGPRADAGPHADHIAIGRDAQAGFGSTGGGISIGAAAASELNGIAIGDGTSARNTNGIAIGNGVSTGGTNAIVIGEGAIASDPHVIAIGTRADAPAENGIAIGIDSDAAGFSGVALGELTVASSDDTVAIGTRAEATNANAIAIGRGAGAGGSKAVAIGFGSSGGGSFSVALGDEASAGGSNSFAQAAAASAAGNHSIAFGELASAGQDHSIVMGQAASSTATNGIAIGSGSSVTSANEINIAGIFKYDGSSDVTLEGSVTSSGNHQVNGQLYSPTFAGSVASATSSIDFDNGNFATLNLTTATFLANPTNLQSGTTYTIILDSGSLISNHGTAWKFAGGTAPTYTDGTDVLTCVSDGTNLYATALTDFQ